MTNKDYDRIVFHEITKNAILNALDSPREINYNLVNAQQARRVLDRLVGYELSPVLWRKVKTGLSAGRVQSVSVRLIVEKEREIKNFLTNSTFKSIGIFKNSSGVNLKAELNNKFDSSDEVKLFLQKNINSIYTVSNVEKKPAKKSPTPPFTTSTLQQEASRKLGFGVTRTMSTAQKLYEAGLITYMRTDSVTISEEAKTSILSIVLSEVAMFTKSKLVKPNVSNFELSLDLDFFVSKPLPTAINLLPFLSSDDAREYFSTAKYPVLIPSAPIFL